MLSSLIHDKTDRISAYRQRKNTNSKINVEWKVNFYLPLQNQFPDEEFRTDKDSEAGWMVRGFSKRISYEDGPWYKDKYIVKENKTPKNKALPPPNMPNIRKRNINKILTTFNLSEEKAISAVIPRITEISIPPNLKAPISDLYLNAEASKGRS